MKQFISFCLINVMALFVSVGFSQIQAPAASPKTTITQAFGLSEITLEYHRPGKKGREIFGDLVQYGAVWRTGANGATAITFKDDVTFAGENVKAGKYSIYTIPGEEEWTIILNSFEGWGTVYDKKKDVLRLSAKAETLAESVETFTIDFSDFTDNSTIMSLKWENVSVPLKIEMEVDSKVMAQIEATMKNPDALNAGSYYQAAAYYLQTDRDLDQALEWVNQSLELDPKPYWVYRLKSSILAGKKEYKAAIQTAEKSMEAAEAAGNMDYVRLNRNNIEEWKKQL
ncbi:DUF2911 domain-containing protein [Flexithrix dorotheae]|uniref:DUF2911 domain-containing protein n=1 Tax=Flexithrix dorotheae TaxID=70993 RepID=UPI000373D3EC|nr:DUF2911 domain-containing protein [Flexithrix dorotheae]